MSRAARCPLLRSQPLPSQPLPSQPLCLSQRLLPLLPLLGLIASCTRAPGETAAAPHAAAPLPAGPLQLSFIADFNPPHSPHSGSSMAAPPAAVSAAPLVAAWNESLGGLSGLYYSERERLLYAISDDARRAPPRLYTFSVQLSDDAFEVRPQSVIVLHANDPSGALLDLDAEAITSDGHTGFWISSENRDELPARRWPRIIQVNRDGQLGSDLPLPEEFLPELTGVPTRGPYTNNAFEGLSLSPSGRWLSAITETALRPGPLASFEQGTTARLLRWDRSAAGAPQQFLYRTEPVPHPAGGESWTDGGNSVSELLSLDDQRLLVLERAYVAPPEGHGINTIRIFELSLPDAAPSTAAPALPLSKRLVLDLNSLIPRLEPGHQVLDNFEAMTLGPRLPSGAQSLLLVTDDNFSDEQRTQFLALRLEASAFGK